MLCHVSCVILAFRDVPQLPSPNLFLTPRSGPRGAGAHPRLQPRRSHHRRAAQRDEVHPPGGQGDPPLPPPRAHGASDGAEALQVDGGLHGARRDHDRALGLVGMHAGGLTGMEVAPLTISQ